MPKYQLIFLFFGFSKI